MNRTLPSHGTTPTVNYNRSVAVGRICLPHWGWGWVVVVVVVVCVCVCVCVCGGWGTNIIPFISFIYISYFFYIILPFFDPIWESYAYKPNFHLLEKAHTNFCSSIRKTAYQPNYEDLFYTF